MRCVLIHAPHLVIAVYLCGWSMHGLWVHFRLFRPAYSDWRAALEAGDLPAQLEAIDRQRDAVRRTRDFLWFMPQP